MTYLEAAQALTAGAEKARLAGDTAASLALALEAAKYLQAARAIERMSQARRDLDRIRGEGSR